MPNKAVVTVNKIRDRKFYGANRETLFIPFAGFRYDDILDGVGELCMYWSSIKDGDLNPFCLAAHSDEYGWLDDCSSGLTIHPVKKLK